MRKDIALYTMRLALLLVTLLTATTGFANQKYWLQVNAKAAPTGAGKVYCTDEYVPVEELADDDYDEETSQIWYVENQGQAGTSRFHLYAQPTDGYVFKNWTKGNNVVSLMKHCTPSERSSSKDPSKPAEFEYRANFVEKGAVAVYSSYESAGTIVIDKPENKVGDTVTLTAYPNNFVGVFLGWIRGKADFENVDLQSLDYLSRDLTYTFTITEANKGDYYAVYRMRTEGIYCMVSNYKTKHCMGLRGTKELTLAPEQRYFQNAVELVPIEKAHSCPATVVKIIGDYDGVGGLVNAQYISQGFTSKDIAGSNIANVPRYFRVEQYTTDTYLTYAEGSGYTGYWREYDDPQKEGYHTTEELLGDIYHPWTGNANTISTDHQWCLLPLTEENMDEYYFGAEPKAAVVQDGLYYTTMYTSFPYKCMDGVKAYTVDKYLRNGRVHLAEVEGGTVPAYTAVILACQGTAAKENRLIPLLTDVEPLTGDNYLKGEIWLDDESGDPANYRTKFDNKTMRVLSDNKAAFVSANNKDATNDNKVLTYIANNTCYLQLDPDKASFSQYTFTTEDDPSAALLGDADNNGQIELKDVVMTTNYVMGSVPSGFYFENADVDQNGVITVADVVGIINILMNK